MRYIQKGNFRKTYFMDSLESYLKILKDIKKDNPNTLLWYRGQKDQAWALEPTLFRYSQRINFQGRIETNIKLSSSYSAIYFNQFFELKKIEEELLKTKNPRKIIPKNYFDLLCLGQHYSLITSLLDFSTDPLVALFFAINELKENEIKIKKINDQLAEFNNKVFQKGSL